MLHPLFAFRVNLGLPSLAGDRLPLSLFFFFFVTGATTAARSTISDPRRPAYELEASERWDGAHGAKNRGPSIENSPI